VVNLKKQSQFIRIAYCVMRIAKRNLKKQSQFVLGRIDVKSYLKGNYSNKPGPRGEKNKANLERD